MSLVVIYWFLTNSAESLARRMGGWWRDNGKVNAAGATSLNGGEPNVLFYIGCEGSSRRNFNVFSMFDEPNGAKYDRQRNRGPRFTVSFAAFRPSNSHVVASRHHIFYLDAEISRSTHHPGLLGIGYCRHR